MVLFVEINPGSTPDAVFADLFTIVLKDLGLGYEPVIGDPTVYRVTYAQQLSAETANRVSSLIKHLGRIVITGLPSDAPGPFGTGLISGKGHTIVEGGIIRIFYDTAQCDGNGVWTVGQDGTHISTPGPVMLYHELSHAHRYATQTTASSEAQEEINATVDENVMRGVMALPPRDIHSRDGGCTGVPAYGSVEQCFIVTAAYGTEAEARVNRLRAIRDDVVRNLPSGQAVFDTLHREYYSFSPAVAAGMLHNESMRATLRELLVEPLYCFFELAFHQTIGNPESSPAARIVQDMERISARHAGLPAQECSSVATALAEGQPLPEHSATGRLLARVLPGGTTRMPLVRWALAGPLAVYWNEHAARSNPVQITQRMSRYVPEWIRKLPPIPGVTEAEHRALLASLKGQPHA
ncbi:CFI-box-CTERM domain-containing protein [Streptomyces smyrnaeus]|uniref:CFI-box-CTERM domain-containing protein n=1 Tax=Streptomyces smyrnaeus TaxID=1387713 RepID=UPI0033A6A198